MDTNERESSEPLASNISASSPNDNNNDESIDDSIQSPGTYSCSTDVLFYKKAQQYWSEVPATLNGMLGGLGHISRIDIEGSSKFLRHFKINYQRALDCGAGIGRVSKELLLPRFQKVDMVEQDTAFTEKARITCTEQFPTRMGEIYNLGLQAFEPETDAYDLIWSQWVLGHLTDADLRVFFQNVRNALHLNAYFIMKENVTSCEETEVDETDSSVTRPLKDYERLIVESGLRLVKVERQLHFPSGLYPVYMIASKRID